MGEGWGPSGVGVFHHAKTAQKDKVPPQAARAALWVSPGKKVGGGGGEKGKKEGGGERVSLDRTRQGRGGAGK